MRPAHRQEIVVALRDLDGLAHVNNAAIVTYLENARTAYLLGGRGKSSVADFDFILARTEIDYRAAAFLHERLEVCLCPRRIGRKSFELAYEVRSLDRGMLVAEALTVCVAYDFAKQESRPIPPDLRALLERDGGGDSP